MALVPLPQTWDLNAASGWKTLRLFLQFVGGPLKAKASGPAQFRSIDWQLPCPSGSFGNDPTKLKSH